MFRESGLAAVVQTVAARKQLGVLRLAILGVVSANLVGGCVLTGGSVRPADPSVAGVRVGASRPGRNAGDVAIYAEGADPARPYTVVAKVTAWGRILTAVSSRPTRGDVDEELRAKAAKLGADAVIKVHYHTSRAGVWPRGYMDASGQAVIFDAPGR